MGGFGGEPHAAVRQLRPLHRLRRRLDLHDDLDERHHWRRREKRRPSERSGRRVHEASCGIGIDDVFDAPGAIAGLGMRVEAGPAPPWSASRDRGVVERGSSGSGELAARVEEVGYQGVRYGSCTANFVSVGT